MFVRRTFEKYRNGSGHFLVVQALDVRSTLNYASNCSLLTGYFLHQEPELPENAQIHFCTFRMFSLQTFLIHCTFKRVCTLVCRMWRDDLIIWECCCCRFITKSYLTCCDPMEPNKLLCPWDFSGKNAAVGFHFLLQGIFPTQVSCLADRSFTV